MLASLIGSYKLTQGINNSRSTINPFLTLFILLWLPVLFSIATAIRTDDVLYKTLAYLLFIPAGVFVLNSIRSENNKQLLFTGLFIIVSIWTLDGCLQFFLGHNLFGYPYTPPQLMGMFYPKVRMPYLLAVLAPVYFEYIRLNFSKRKWLLLLLIPFGMMILLGGKRSAWIMLAFSGSGYLIYLYLLNKGLELKRVLLAGALILLPLILLSITHVPLKQRITSTLGLFTSDAVEIDRATAHRVELWKVAFAMAKDNWLTGVGPRGFRHAFSDYAEADNFWIRAGFSQGTTHPHLQILEIACETGLVGLIMYAIFYFLLLRLLYQEIRAGRLRSMPWLLCPLTAYFPLNAHLAFYGSYWTSVSIWMLAVSLAVVNSDRHGQNTDN